MCSSSVALHSTSICFTLLHCFIFLQKLVFKTFPNEKEWHWQWCCAPPAQAVALLCAHRSVGACPPEGPLVTFFLWFTLSLIEFTLRVMESIQMAAGLHFSLCANLMAMLTDKRFLVTIGQ